MDRLRENWIGYVFIIPTFLMFGLLFYYPMLRGLYVTFTNIGLGGTGGEFVGLANYAWLLSNDLFWFALGWTIVFVLGTTGLQLIVGLIVALLLNELAGRSECRVRRQGARVHEVHRRTHHQVRETCASSLVRPWAVGRFVISLNSNGVEARP